MRLFSRHPTALQTAFSDLKRQASEQTSVLVGTPGSVSKRVVEGRSFWYRQYYDPSDRKSADYIGPVDEPVAEAKAEATRTQIEVANALLSQARMLARLGYLRVDARTEAVVAACANNGLFRAGALLVGSHAFGALLNELGAKGAGYATEDIDIARNRALRLDAPRPFAEILADSKIGLQPIPPLDRKGAPTSYKPPGADRLRVDLLVPTRGTDVKVLEVRDLGAHATGLPWFDWLLDDPIETILLGRSSVVPVKVPRPERLAWHKMLVSELRGRTNDKKHRDREQAAVLAAVLAEHEPGVLEDAFRELPRSARTATKAGARATLPLLDAHERADSVMRALVL